MLCICKINVTKAFSMLDKELAQILNVALRPVEKGTKSLLAGCMTLFLVLESPDFKLQDVLYLGH